VTDQTGPAVLEPTVLEIVQEVLERGARVRLSDDLYDLGFDSLRIMQVAARVGERLGVEAPLAAYFDAGTVADLVAVIASAPAIAATTPASEEPA
jgi:acyl carrier protein